jgi:hypothetical protein
MAQDPIRLRSVALAELGDVEPAYALGEVSDGGLPLLVVRLRGAGSHQDPDPFDLAAALVMAGLEAWQPWAVILDLREFQYRWGDRMQNVLWAPQRWYEPVHPLRGVFTGGKVPKEFPVAVVVSDLNRDGLESLVRDEMKADPGTWLFESVEAAAAALGERLAGVPLA